MIARDAPPFDLDLLDRPPASLWPGRLVTAVTAMFLSLGLAMVTALYPLAGIAVTLGLCGLLLLVRVPETILVLFGFSLGVPYQISVAGLPVNAADAMLVLWWICIPLILLRSGAPWQMPFLVKAVLPFIVAVAISILIATDPPGQFKQLNSHYTMVRGVADGVLPVPARRPIAPTTCRIAYGSSLRFCDRRRCRVFQPRQLDFTNDRHFRSRAEGHKL